MARRKSKKWIQPAIKREGRVRNYLLETYGGKAFTSDGKIKMEYLDKAIKRIESREGRDVKDLLKALRAAKTLKKMARKRRK